MKKTLQKGFSLVELLVVVAIIGVLAGVGVVAIKVTQILQKREWPLQISIQLKDLWKQS